MKRRLLIVDNEVDVCNFIKLFFESRGFQVFTALNADDALLFDAEAAMEVVLLDVRMRSETEGIEYLPRIRQSFPKARVILVSGIDDPSVMDHAKSLGAECYLTKPLLLDQLESLVANPADVPDFGTV